MLVHIPDTGHVTTRDYGWYANRPRGMREKAVPGIDRHRAHLMQGGMTGAVRLLFQRPGPYYSFVSAMARRLMLPPNVSNRHRTAHDFSRQ